MKQFNTEYKTAQDADISEVTRIIGELFSNQSEEWICVYKASDSDPSYIQTHAGIEYLEDNVRQYLMETYSLTKKELKAIKTRYLVEYRHYETMKHFKHYRAYFLKTDEVSALFEDFINDQVLDVSNWLDVSHQFSE